MSTLVGRTVGGYHLELPLGAGATGQTYRARTLADGREVAVKVMSPRLAAEPGFRERFRELAGAAAALRHPNVLPIHEVAERDGLFYLVMDYLPDGSLRMLLERRAELLPLARGLAIVRQAAEGIGHAHAQGLLHRDVKPENLLLRRDPASRSGVAADVQVADFGLTRLAETGVTLGGDVAIGSPPYMSPEQCRGLPCDARSDVYSLGVVLYEVATGFPPFQVRTIGEAVTKHVTVPPPPPRTVAPAIPEAVEAIILRCLEKPPEKRFASAGELVAALGAVLADADAGLKVPNVRLAETPRVVLAASEPARPAPPAPAPPVAAPAAGRDADRVHRVELEGGAPRRQFRVRMDGDDAPAAPPPVVVPPTAALPTPAPAPPRAAVPAGSDAAPRRIPVKLDEEAAREARKLPNRAPPAAQPEQRRIRVVLDGDALLLTPGVPALVQATVANTGSTVDHIDVKVEGVPDDWLRGPPVAIQLNPGQRVTVPLTVVVPVLASSEARAYPVLVRARSRDKDGPNDSGTASATWTVLPFARFTLALAPARLRAWRRARASVQLRNDGNGSARLALAGADDERALRYRFAPAELEVAPGETATAALTVTGPLRWLGSPELRAFSVRADPAADGAGALPAPAAAAPAAPQVVQGQLVHRALVPGWLPPLLVAAAIALFFWQRTQEQERQLVLAVTPSRLPVVVGADARFKATVTNRANEVVEGQPVAWIVEDTTVATVSPEGEVRGRREGVTVVTASTGGRTATAEVQVTRAAVGALALTPTRLGMRVGDAARVRATPRDANGDPLETVVLWTSSDPTVATVGGDGRVVAKGPGSATITAQSEAKIATAVVNVAPLPEPVVAGGGAGGAAGGAGGGAPAADCVGYEPAALRIADRKAAGQVVTDGSTDLLALDTETDARRALALAKRYKAHCFLGRNNTRPNKSEFVIEYWEEPSGVATTIDAEDCVALDKPALRIADQGPQGWVLADSRRVLLLADSRADAQKAWEIAQRHSALCFIGRGNTRPNQRDYLVQYWR